MQTFSLPILLENCKISDIFVKANHALILDNLEVLENITESKEKTKTLKNLWANVYGIRLSDSDQNDIPWNMMLFDSQASLTAFVLRWG